MSLRTGFKSISGEVGTAQRRLVDIGPKTVGIVALLSLTVSGVAFLVAKYDLRMILVAFSLLAFVVLMFFKPQATTLAVLFGLYINVGAVLVQYHGVPQFAAASFFLILGIPLLHYLLIRRQRLIADRTLFLMCAYLFILLLTVTHSNDPTQSIDVILTYFLEGVVLYFLVLNSLRSSLLLRRAIWTLILAGSLMGSLSLYQELTKSYDNEFFGFAQVANSEISGGEDEDTGKKIARNRLAGPIGSKNRYAQIMVVLLPLALFRLWGERSRMLRLLAAAACVPIVAGALLTFSRGAGVTILAILSLMLLLGYLKVRHFVVLLLAGAAVTAMFVPQYVYRLSSLSRVTSMFSGGAKEADASVRGRATENLAMLYIFFDHPILGVGVGQANLYTAEYGNRVGLRKIEGARRGHNLYLEELAATGIVGFSAFIAIVLLMLRSLARAGRRWARARPDFANIAASFFCAITAYLVSAVFLHLAYQRYYWIWLALAGAALKIFRNEGNSELIEVLPAAIKTRER